MDCALPLLFDSGVWLEVEYCLPNAMCKDVAVQDIDPADIEWSNFGYAIHHAEHSKLDGKQRQAVQHYTEMTQRLIKKRDHYQARVAAIPRSGLGISLRLDPVMQDEFYELTQSFFEHAYSTVSALASVHGRVKIFSKDDVPIKSVERYLDWWSKQPSFLNQEASVEILLQSRDFRTILSHPQQIAVFNWGTLADRQENTVRIVLHGEVSSMGSIPVGSSAEPGNSARWFFEAPSMNRFLWALLNLTSLMFHAMPGTFPLDPEDEICTWEADGFGSAPAIALAKLVANLDWGDLAHLRPEA